MSNEISKLTPKEVWENFYQLTRIPRPSYHEEEVRKFIADFGKGLGLETIQDAAGNVIVRKPATPGMEKRKGVILQGHLDMVPQKNSDKNHDFTKDPIETVIDGEWVRANGTTLGSDNGIGVAAAMAVLASKDLAHGPIEALFTATEETGMDGANGIKPGILKGDILLNMDSEDEGELYVGCAGGEDASIQFKFKEVEVPGESIAFRLNVTGLKGGHSGLDIVLGRGNANKIFFRLLKETHKTCGVRLASINGGNLRNAIPREAFGVITVPYEKADKLVGQIAGLTSIIKRELTVTEPTLKIELSKMDMPASLIDLQTQVNLTHAIVACPNGVIRMSDTMLGLVETSTNLAIVISDTTTKTIEVSCLMRSSVDTARAELGSRMDSVFTLAGAEVTLKGGYPGWKPNMESPILKTMQQVYQSKFGRIPEIKAIHAGLECGILGGTYPNWDMISFGPTIRFPHSPDEKVNIESVCKFWDFLVETLKNIPGK
ncbi:MAG TPA: cytosol nonspecific dipeptidase [Prolixibacteraceae bacterium]|jgi:dipeptidase D|nr:cytosol nonspecific dipeptidase [Prolixibacteraceae bacterium]